MNKSVTAENEEVTYAVAMDVLCCLLGSLEEERKCVQNGVQIQLE